MHLVDLARAHIEETGRRSLAERMLRALLAAIIPYPDRFRRALYYPVLMNKQVTARLSELVTVSQTAARSCARAFGIPESRIRVIYNGVDVETFLPDPAAQKIPGRLIFVGNTEDRKKGIRYLLEALMLLPKEVTLTVVDGGAPRHLLMEELRRKFNLGDRVQCTGKIPTAELVKKYREAEIAVSPSLYEGFGFPAAEAMACGLPVVSSDGGALPEVVGTDGKAGFIVPRRNPAALAEAVKKLIGVPALRSRMGRAGRERIVEKFSWDAACGQMVELYREAIARRKKA
jgi:glycosyltransferase involved in cell wall biosynthesis